MRIWEAAGQTYKPFASLPRLLTVVRERIDSPSYRHEGRYRQSESHCLFKYTLSGEGRFADASGEYAVPPGSGFLCEIYDPATAYYYPPHAQAPWDFFFVCFDGPAAIATVREIIQRHGPLFTLPRDGEVIERLLAWRHLAGTPLWITPAEGAAATMELLTALLRSKEAEAQEGMANQLVLRAQSYIRTHVQVPLTASQLAERLGVSREHLTRVFHAQLGQTPYQSILREKLLLACRLLKESDLSVKEICARTGCDSPALFSRRFKQALGMPPGVFRKVGTVPVR
jgi:AraC-like DNA-binding protein